VGVSKLSALGIIALFASLASIFVLKRLYSPLTLTIFFALLLMHFVATYWAYLYSLSNPADSNMYFYNTRRMNWEDARSSTGFILFVVQYMRSLFGGGILDYFYLFQIFGLLGLVVIFRTIQELFVSIQSETLALPYMLLFLPGLHFWTVWVGKDAPLFFSVALAIWASLRLSRRYPAFLLAVVIMLPIRPHVAGLAMASLAVAVLFGRGIKPLYRGLLGAGALGIFLAILPSVRAVLQVDSLDLDTVSDFIATRQEYGLRDDVGGSFVNLPFPLRMASLLFRPFYFDAKGFMGLVASFENTIWLGVFGFLAWRFRDVYNCALENLFVRFCVVYAGTLTILLTLVNYNIGLGLRQKMMIMPAVLVLLAATLVWRRLEAQDAKRSVASDVEVRPAGVVS
jgi:hypothetical protein